MQNCEFVTLISVLACSIAKDKSPEELSNIFKDYMDQFVEEGFIYEAVFGKKMYTYDQIELEDSAFPIIDYYTRMETISEMVKNYITYNKEIRYNNFVVAIDEDAYPDQVSICLFSIKDNKYRLESVKFPDLYIESDHYMGKDSIEKSILESIIGGLHNE